ncbi:hypothetical protein J437_LFUL011570 [Ladona fulva]|uniref:Tubulin--tyrosine ligase-like protein 9 n=1 Tax=Ladona fulva TaxID=123851 RepID=A0A8K0P5F3_LADFU|nr:hypothetical protein J437_LFUL011570 [Ladona fulva]
MIEKLPKSKILSPNQRIPHFSNNYELTSKNLLARNLKRLWRVLIKDGHLEDAELCNSIPLTFELPSEYLMFVEEYKKNPGATWIVKPASGCQGRGIFLFQKLRDLNSKRLMESNSDSNSGCGTSYVVQRYIESPYLLAGHKFDLRIYALVTSEIKALNMFQFSPLKIWLAREGFARLTGVKYSLSTLDDKVHLTNVAIQKSTCPSRNLIPACSTSSATKKPMLTVRSHAYVESDEGNQRSETASECKGVKWDLRKLRQFLSAKHGEENVEIIFQRITRLITVSLRAVQPVIAQDAHCFELYGYDIILDSNLYPWILEVNASPAMVPTDEEDYRLKYDLITDVLNVLDFEGK